MKQPGELVLDPCLAGSRFLSQLLVPELAASWRGPASFAAACTAPRGDDTGGHVLYPPVRTTSSRTPPSTMQAPAPPV